MGHGPMSALAENFQIKPIHGSQERAGPDTNGTLGNFGPHVAADGIVNLGIFHDAFIDHGFGATGPFLGRLKHEFNGSSKFIPDFIKHGGRPQPHGHVGIMPAGMHHSVMGGRKLQTGFLLKQKGIHVGPDQQRRPGSAGIQQTHHAKLSNAGLMLQTLPL